MDNKQAPTTTEIQTTRTTTRKIGNCTFIVTSSFNENTKGDIVSKIARLIQNDVEQGA